jgi:hypothetical protein
MNFRSRLQRLEQQAPALACPACADRRGRFVFIDGHDVAGEFVPDPGQPDPQPCPVCGQVPEFIIQVCTSEAVA